MSENNATKKQRKFGNVALNALCYVTSKRWGPATLAKYLVERPFLLPVKHRTKSFDEIFDLLRQQYHRLAKNGYIKKNSYGDWEITETARHKGLRFVSMSELSLESKQYIPHNKRLIFLINSVDVNKIKNWKIVPLRGWNKLVYENDRITAELVPAHKFFKIPGAKGLIVRLKEPRWFAIIKTEEDVEEVNALYDSEIIHETNLLAENFNFDIDTLNPQELLQDGEIHDIFTETLPDKMHFTNTVVKYNSAYGGNSGNKKMEFKTAGEVKDYVRESVNTERMKTVEELLPELIRQSVITNENFNAHIPFLDQGTKAAVENQKTAVEIREVLNDIKTTLSDFANGKNSHFEITKKKPDRNIKEFLEKKEVKLNEKFKPKDN